MLLNSEISKYVFRSLLFSTFVTLFCLLAVTLIGDLVEYSKKLSAYDLNDFSLLFMLILLNLPRMLLEVLPFALLFGGMLWTVKINSSRELLVMRASGVSLLRLCIPISMVGIILGFVFILILSPLLSATQKKIQNIESEKLGKPINSILVSQNGFWLKQTTENGHDIIYAKSLDVKRLYLLDIIFFQFDKNHQIINKINAKSAELVDKYWLLNYLQITDKSGKVSKQEFLRIPTSITSSQIRGGLSSPETVSIWNLAPFIKMFERAGFSVKKHRLYFYKLITFPFFLASMSVLGVSFNMKGHSKKISNFRLLIGVISGFSIFYISKIMSALAISGKLSLFFSSLIPTIIPLIVGLTIIIHANEK